MFLLLKIYFKNFRFSGICFMKNVIIICVVTLGFISCSSQKQTISVRTDFNFGGDATEYVMRYDTTSVGKVETVSIEQENIVVNIDTASEKLIPVTTMKTNRSLKKKLRFLKRSKAYSFDTKTTPQKKKEPLPVNLWNVLLIVLIVIVLIFLLYLLAWLIILSSFGL
jgi:ATP-dependent Zn protease